MKRNDITTTFHGSSIFITKLMSYEILLLIPILTFSMTLQRNYSFSFMVPFPVAEDAFVILKMTMIKLMKTIHYDMKRAVFQRGGVAAAAVTIGKSRAKIFLCRILRYWIIKAAQLCPPPSPKTIVSSYNPTRNAEMHQKIASVSHSYPLMKSLSYLFDFVRLEIAVKVNISLKI